MFAVMRRYIPILYVCDSMHAITVNLMLMLNFLVLTKKIFPQLLHLISLSLIAVMMVHPDILKQSGSSHGGINSGTEQLSVEPLDVQAVRCGTETPCILAAQGEGKTDQVTSNDFSLSLSNFMTTHRPNTGTVNTKFTHFPYLF